MKLNGYFWISLSGLFWGTQGCFVKALSNGGLSPLQIVICRLLVGSLLLFAFIMVQSPSSLKLDRKGLMLALSIGLFSQAGFNFFYFNAIGYIGISSSAVLLYTSPIFLAIWSVLFFKEHMNLVKLGSIFLCIIGCFVAVTGGQFSLAGISRIGIAFGLLAALSFSAMSAISRVALKDYPAAGILFYSFLSGGLAVLPFADPIGLLLKASIPTTALLILGLGLVPSSLAYMCYYKGVSCPKVDLSKAGVVSSLEMVFSILFAVWIYHEGISALKLVGILTIIASIVLSQISFDRIPEPEDAPLIDG